MKNKNNKCDIQHRFNDRWWNCLDSWLIGICVVLLVIGVIVGGCWLVIKIHTGFWGVDVAIQVAVLSFLGSSIGFLLSKNMILNVNCMNNL